MPPVSAQPKSDKPRRDRGSGARRLLTSGTRRRPTVLIVDDDEDARELYAWCMRAAGWIVEAVPNGEDALFVTAVLAPDAIVMDLRLPVIDGFEATRRLKADPDTRHIPIVAISGTDQQQSQAFATEAGFEAFVAKPCPPEDLREFLETLIERREGSAM